MIHPVNNARGPGASRLQLQVMSDRGPGILRRLKHRTRGLRREVFAIYLAIRHPATPWYAKALAVAVVVYAVSPFDLIADPIPVLGYLDDLVIVPLGVFAVRRMIPSGVLAECREKAAGGVQVGPGWKWAGGIVIGSLWLLCIALLACWGWRRLGRW
jgi:uncharacterized membrane protein YkvA (DUF1232 family)